MLHKRYFVALLCGALCLVGCLKNEESPSVTQVRNAKANELNAQAKLLEAQAAAQTTLAAAEAKLKEAQAELEKANAKKVAAETQLLEVEAELRSVEVELARVNVDKAKAELQYRKAELEALAYQLQVLIAEADKDLARIEKELQQIAAQIEIEAIQQQLALLQQEKALEDYLAGLDAEAQADLEATLRLYFQLKRRILEAEIDIRNNQIQMALNDEQDEANYDQLVEDYNDYLNEAERISMLIEKAEEYLLFDEDEVREVKNQLDTMLITAYNEQLAVTKAFNEASDDADDMYDETFGVGTRYYYADAYDSFVYNLSRSGGNWNYAFSYDSYNGISIETPDGDYMGSHRIMDNILEGEAWVAWKAIDEENDIWGYQFGYYDENDEWVVLHTYTYDAGEYVFMDDEWKAEYEANVAAGIYDWPDSYGAIWQPKYVPGESNLENYNALIDAYVADAKDALDAEKEEAGEIADAIAEQYQPQLDYVDKQIAKTKEYVDGLSAKFEAADQAVEDAEEDWGDATEAKQAARMAWDLARIPNAKLEEALAAWFIADDEEDEAADAYILAKNDSTEAYWDVVITEAEFVAEYTGEWKEPVSEEDMATAIFNRDDAIAVATAELNAAKKAVAAGSDLEKAYSAAKKATNDAKDTVAVKEDNLKKALAAYRAAKILSDEKPDDATLAGNTQKAEKAYNDAVDSLNAAQGRLDTALEAYSCDNDGNEWGTATDDYVTAQGTVTEKEAALKDKTDRKDAWELRFNNPEEFEDENENIVPVGVNVAYAAAKQAAEDAYAAWEAAAAAEDAAYEKVEEEEEALASEEYEAYMDALDAEEEAEEAYWDACATVDSLEFIYRHYRRDVAALDEEVDEATEEIKGVLVRWRATLAARIEDKIADYDNDGEEEAYADYIDELDAEFAEAEEFFNNFKAELAKYESQYRPAFVAGVEAYNTAYEEVVDLYFEKVIADLNVEMLKAVKDMLVSTFVNEEGEEVGVQEYINGLVAQLEALTEAINDKIDNWQTDYQYINANARLELENERLEAWIELWEAQLAELAEILSEFFEGNYE